MGTTIGLYVDNEPGYGGGYTYWQSMISALKTKSEINGWEIVVFSPQSGWEQECKKLGVEFCYTKIKKVQTAFERVLFYLLPHIVYKKIILKIVPYIAYAYMKDLKYMFSFDIENMLYRVLRIKHICPICDLMHIYESEFPEVSSRREQRIRNRRFALICKKATCILVDSKIGRNQVVESYAKYATDLDEKIKILPYIPAKYVYDGIEEEPSNLRFVKYAFYPAQFWTHKNHQNLIKAICKLRDEGVTVNLVLVGSDQNNLKNIDMLVKAKKLEKQIQYLGFVSDEEIVYLYKHARLLCMPTYFGPTNIPPLEAFVLGCPVAVSNIYAMPEQMGGAALLFNPDSVEEISECIKRLWDDEELCNKLTQEGLKVSKAWGMEQFTERLENIINSLIQKE